MYPDRNSSTSDSKYPKRTATLIWRTIETIRRTLGTIVYPIRTILSGGVVAKKQISLFLQMPSSIYKTNFPEAIFHCYGLYGI